MSLAPLMGIPGKLKTLITNLATVDTNVDTLIARLTSTRAGNLDDLDVSVSSRASQTSITTLQNSVNTVDSVVDGIAADVAALPTGSLVKHAEVTVTGSGSQFTLYAVALGASFDPGRSQVQIDTPMTSTTPFYGIPLYRWNGTSEIICYFTEIGAAAQVEVPTSRNFKVTVQEFAQ